MKQYHGHLITPQSITVFFTEGHPVSISKEDLRYDALYSSIKLRQTDRIIALTDKAAQIEQHTRGKFMVVDGLIVIDNQPLPKSLSDKLLAFVDANLDTQPLENFWTNLKKNPSQESVKDLFDFMRVNKMPITHSGNFIAYKRVRDDYLDFYKGEFLNAPGRVIKMEREMVDANREHTCAQGLHVAAFDYAAKSYHSGQGKIMEVEVNPRDVVAVPPDYNQQKMRVCRYRVLGPAQHEIEDLLYTKEPVEANHDIL